MKKLAHQLGKTLSLIFMCLTAVFLIGLQIKPAAWILWGLGLASLLLAKPEVRADFSLLYFSIFILGIAPIETDLTASNILTMGGALVVALGLPFIITRYIRKDQSISYRWHHGRKWKKRELSYILITAAISYFLLPFYLQDTGAYLNWTVEAGAMNIFLLFLGTNALGIWDELFFVNTVLGLLGKHLSLFWANLVQAVLFTAFLYELGFTGWAFPILYAFALLQGWIFRKTESLFYVISIHLTLDLILFLALIHAHHPAWMPIFIT